MVVYGESSSNSRSRTTTFWGWLLMGIGSVVLPGFLFITFISKLLLPSNYPLIAAIQSDSLLMINQISFRYTGQTRKYHQGNWTDKKIPSRYYCYLVPLTLPVLVVAVYFHWLSMKLFKHA